MANKKTFINDENKLGIIFWIIFIFDKYPCQKYILIVVYNWYWYFLFSAFFFFFIYYIQHLIFMRLFSMMVMLFLVDFFFLHHFHTVIDDTACTTYFYYTYRHYYPIPFSERHSQPRRHHTDIRQWTYYAYGCIPKDIPFNWIQFQYDNMFAFNFFRFFY